MSRRRPRPSSPGFHFEISYRDAGESWEAMAKAEVRAGGLVPVLSLRKGTKGLVVLREREFMALLKTFNESLSKAPF